MVSYKCINTDKKPQKQDMIINLFSVDRSSGQILNSFNIAYKMEIIIFTLHYITEFL